MQQENQNRMPPRMQQENPTTKTNPSTPQK
jgi:hypothetical protein